MSDPAPTAQIGRVTVTVPLEEPLHRESGPIASLTLRKPKSGEMRGLKVGELMVGEIGAVLALLPRIATPFLTDTEIGEIACQDIAEIAGVITGFFMTQSQKAMVAKMFDASA